MALSDRSLWRINSVASGGIADINGRVASAENVESGPFQTSAALANYQRDMI